MSNRERETAITVEYIMSAGIAGNQAIAEDRAVEHIKVGWTLARKFGSLQGKGMASQGDHELETRKNRGVNRWCQGHASDINRERPDG
jgi:hypothetical protein